MMLRAVSGTASFPGWHQCLYTVGELYHHRSASLIKTVGCGKAKGRRMKGE